MNDTIVFDLHEDELSAFECMGVPAEHYAVTNSTRGTHWVEIHIAAEWSEKFLIMTWLLDWHSGTFGKYYASH